MRSDSGKQAERRREFLQKVGRGAAGAAVVTAGLATAKPGRAGIRGGYGGHGNGGWFGGGNGHGRRRRRGGNGPVD